MNLVATFNAKVIAACGMYYATSGTRYYLSGILLEPTDDGCYLVATDGCTLLAVHDSGDHLIAPDKALIVKFEKSTLSKAKTKAAEYVLLQRDGDDWYATVKTDKGETFTAPCKLLDKQYPDWRRVIPKPTEDSAPPNFDPEYLKQAGEAAMLLGSSDIAIFYSGPNTAATWTCFRVDDNLDVIGVIMPTKNLNLALPRIRGATDKLTPATK